MKEQDGNKMENKKKILELWWQKYSKIEELEDKVEYKEKIGRLIQDMQHLSTGDPRKRTRRKESEENSPWSKIMNFQMEISGTVNEKNPLQGTSL